MHLNPTVRMLVVLGACSAVGCSGDGDNTTPTPTPTPTPSVTQVTVTVLRVSVPLEAAEVISSADLDGYKAVGVQQTLMTDSAGKATFDVPASTSTGVLCFSSKRVVPYGSTEAAGFASQCKSLNNLPSELTLVHTR